MRVIGVDPGTETGLAQWLVPQQRFEAVTTFMLHEALAHTLSVYHAVAGELLVMFEDARRSRVSRKAKTYGQENRLQGVGSVKRDSAIWEEFLQDHRIPFVATAPLYGGTKWDSARFAAQTKWVGRTSNHARDAAVRVYGLNEPQVRAMIREWHQRQSIGANLKASRQRNPKSAAVPS